ncbi:hypothetical protein SYNPCC7002_A2731 [Picosynechococcus sp. PCC 7002]|nr:hypothetical protein SYNPCC7002_A2731 [Picosynechococcus sp. PCC 7002]
MNLFFNDCPQGFLKSELFFWRKDTFFDPGQSCGRILLGSIPDKIGLSELYEKSLGADWYASNVQTANGDRLGCGDCKFRLGQF